jgi:hypothetical protein
MSNSIVIRVLKKDDSSGIAQARANIQVEHIIKYEGEATGCTVDTVAFNAGNEFYPDAYVIVGVKE